MRLVTVSGPPSSGKTAVTSKVLLILETQGLRAGVIKVDCLSTEDHEAYKALGLRSERGLSGSLCPDHYFASNLDEIVAWGKAHHLDVLATESAGLCNRCSPHITDVLAVCILDCLGGINTPKKLGPMVKHADIVVLTKGDLVSQAEREVFAFQLRQANAKGILLFVNGLTGQGTHELATLWRDLAKEVPDWDDQRLRFPMPAALCSYCLGETRLGRNYQIGNLRKLEFSE